MRSRWFLLALSVVGALPARAQGGPEPGLDSLRVGDRMFERVAGFSWHSPGAWGDVTHRRVYITGMRTSWVLSAKGAGAVAYTMELVPLAIVERTSPNSVVCWEVPGFDICRRDVSARVAIGVGGSPIGFRAYWKRAGRFRFHTTGAVGGMVFSSAVPTQDSRRLNITVSASAGFDIRTRGGREIALGYKFHHLSNAGTAPVNPGLDANVIYVGLTGRRPRN